MRYHGKSEKLPNNWQHTSRSVNRNIVHVWYMCLKIENCCLKIFIETRVSEKICENTCNVI